jgi:hypothetical protein
MIRGFKSSPLNRIKEQGIENIYPVNAISFHRYFEMIQSRIVHIL